MIEEPILTELRMPLKTFLTFPTCPPRWKGYDLYIVQDAQVAFYVGQSYCAFDRVWEHIHGGPHGHSLLGRFVLANWPRSGSFTVTLLDSRSERFAPLLNNRDAAERTLIETMTPCFNTALNGTPAPLPMEYLPPNAPIKFLKSYKRMIREAGYASRKNPADTEWE